MISYLGAWIKNIVLLIFLATFLDLILPNTQLKRYVKLVVGLLLLLMILSPILQLFRFDYDRLLTSIDQLLVEKQSSMGGEIQEKQHRINNIQEGMLLEEVATYWSDEMKQGIEKNYNIAIDHIELSLINKNQEAVVQQLVVQANTTSDQEKPPSPSLEIEPIQPVMIQVPEAKGRKSKQAQISNEQKKIEKEVLNYIQDEWNISVDKISFSWRGGDQNE